jgi:outer membrane protein OmpA-like peptidoglycan-associated protein/tetratricopeptide (TPR) repeat protein
MKKFILLYVAILSVVSYNSYAQKSTLAAADKKYDKLSYLKTVDTYERLVKKGYKSEDVFQKLGNSYYFNGELDKAAKWYDELFNMNPKQESEYCYRYAQSLKSIGQNEKANQMLEIFHLQSVNDIRGNLFINNKNYLDKIKVNSGRFTIEDAGINTKYSDYGSAFYGNKLVFSSARDTSSLVKRKHTWTNQYFTNLFISDLDEKQTPSKVEKFSKTINSKFGESTPVFTKDGKTMYFTRNNYLQGKVGTDGKKVTLVKIYKASFDENKWSNIVELPFTTDNHSFAHPTLSPDEKTLYFASDMPGTFGQSDLFEVKIKYDGSYSIPRNLGKGINTEGRETFPMITDENELYFASDGHLGLGGLDIFVAKMSANGNIEEIHNVGDGVNSPKDDYAFLIDTKTRRGFFTSNRDGGLGDDDIYKFLETKKLVCVQELYGTVTDKFTLKAIPNAKMSLFDSTNKLIGNAIADALGNYTFAVECNKIYSVSAAKTDYIAKDQKITIANKNGKTNLNIALEKEPIKVVVGDDAGKYFGIRMIYFDLNKYDITAQAVEQLEQILGFMKQYPTTKVDVRSHTDCRQTMQYNQLLSDNRAKSTIDWLVKNGIDSGRLTGKGYGETQLVNNCGCEPSDRSKCTEAQHQMNRRSEFIITAF